MTRNRLTLLATNLLFVLVVASGIAWLLYRTDVKRVVQEAAQPYTTLRIIPNTLTQRTISGQWGLFYAIETLKREGCAEVLIERFVHRVGEAEPVAINRDLTGEIVAPSEVATVTKGLYVRLAKPLGPGDYFLLLKATCYVVNGKGVKIALAPRAEAFICFQVPLVTAHVEEPQRLQPVSEDCRLRAD